MEQKLVDFACNRASMGIGFCKKQFLEYAGKLAYKCQCPFAKGNSSEKWWRQFKKRNPSLKLRQPEGTAAVQHQCMDRSKILKYFHALNGVVEKYRVKTCESRICNTDETGMNLEHKTRRVLAQKVARYIHSRTSGNKETITVIACINADSYAIPPHFICKGKTEKTIHGFDVISSPVGSKWSVSDLE